MPKPKAHRKAGMTGAMKNMVGICVRKEYLPHHTQGSSYELGDEYLSKSFFLFKSAICLDKYYNENCKLKKYLYKKASGWLYKAGKLFTHEAFKEGNWYGNDTIWRTILDLNHIILYADKTGKIMPTIQRSILTIADMVIVGEHEGPLRPTPKNLGIVLFGTNNGACDCVIAKLFGFDSRKIKYLKKIYENEKNNIMVKNTIHIKPLVHLEANKMYHIEPTTGWKNNIEL